MRLTFRRPEKYLKTFNLNKLFIESWAGTSCR